DLLTQLTDYGFITPRQRNSVHQEIPSAWKALENHGLQLNDEKGKTISGLLQFVSEEKTLLGKLKILALALDDNKCAHRPSTKHNTETTEQLIRNLIREIQPFPCEIKLENYTLVLTFSSLENKEELKILLEAIIPVKEAV